MTPAPPLTDLHALPRNRARLRETFILESVADEFEDRLKEINRPFTDIGIISGQPQFWAQNFPNARMIRDDDRLDVTQGSFDLILHAMSLHWANDPLGQIIQSRRALRPDGLFMAALFGGNTLAALRSVLAEAEVALTGGLSPRVAPMAEIRDLGALLQRADLALPVADAMTFNVQYRDVFHLMRDVRAMGEGNALNARLRHPTRRAVFDTAAALYKQHFAAPDGRINAVFDVIFLTGWSKHDSQQRPLRPGSATHSLADVLGHKT